MGLHILSRTRGQARRSPAERPEEEERPSAEALGRSQQPGPELSAAETTGHQTQTWVGSGVGEEGRKLGMGVGGVRWEWGLSYFSGLSASSLRFVIHRWAAGEL